MLAINGRAGETDCGQHAIEQFAGPADERQAFNVLVAARSFADEHKPRRRAAVGKDKLRRGRLQSAAIKFFENAT
jgi:hypothetical protein